jgi:hypothetical protein
VSDPERGTWIYVTADSRQWLKLDLPFGLIAPPILELHQPLAGPVLFYYAEGYQLPVPEEARGQL